MLDETGTVAIGGGFHMVKKKIALTDTETENILITPPRGAVRTRCIATTVPNWGTLPDFSPRVGA